MRKFRVGNKIITLLYRTNLISEFYVFGTILLRKIWWFEISQSDKKNEYSYVSLVRQIRKMFKLFGDRKHLQLL